jgi:hypothetical protein
VRVQAKIIGRHIAGNLQQARAPHSRPLRDDIAMMNSTD